MAFRLRFALISVFLILVQARAFAQSALVCEDLFADGSFSFQDLQHYRIFLKDTNEVLSAVYVGQATGGAVFDDGYKTVTILPDQIIDAVPVSRESLRSVIDPVMGRLRLAQKATNLILKPLRKIAKGDDRIEVVGTLQTSKDLGEKIYTSLKRFDQHMESLGFVAPDKTRIIVSEKAYLKDLFLGPFSLNIPIVNIWQGREALPIISLAPLGRQAEAVRDEAVLFHERTHSFLTTTYKLDAYVNRSGPIEEALADFAALQFIGKPLFGTNLGGDGKSLRDVGSRTLSRQGYSVVHDRLLRAIDGDAHGNSLFISNLIWRVRETIGSEKMNQIFKPLIENLNAYDSSYRARIQSERPPTHDDIVWLSRDIEYTMSVLVRTGRDLNDRDLSADIESVVGNYADEIGFSRARIDTIARSLVKQEGVNRLPEKSGWERRKDVIMIHAYGAIGFMTDAFVLTGMGALGLLFK